MSRMIDLVFPSPEPTSSPSSSSLSTSAPSSSTSTRSGLLPLFITCDPARDTPSVLKSYLSEFHPSIIGLTGTWEQIRQVCKAYRVYFSTPEGVKPGMDYLVDHSIYFYLMGGLFRTGVIGFPFPSFLSPKIPQNLLNNRSLKPKADSFWSFSLQIRMAISSKPLDASIARRKQRGSSRHTCRIGKMGRSYPR